MRKKASDRGSTRTASKPGKPAAGNSVSKPRKRSSPVTAGLEEPVHEPAVAPWTGLPEVSEARRRVAAQLKGVDAAAWIEELTRLHASRSLRTLKASGLLQSTQTRLVEALLENSAHRSRCAEIKMQALTVSLRCEAVLDAVRRVILQTYADDVKASGSTIAERKGAVDAAFLGEVEQVEMLQHVLKMADIVISDIDQSHWSLRGVIDTLSMTMGGKGAPTKS